MNEVINLMKNHRSIRKYTNEEVSEEIIENLIAVAQHAPNSINGQQSSVIVIRDKETKEKIAEYAGGQTWVEQCPVFLVFVMDFYKSKVACEKNGRELNITDSVEAIMAGSVDVGIAMQNVVTAAESLGLGVVCIGGIRKNPRGMIKILNLPEYTYPVVGLCLGYPSDNSRLKPRMDSKVYAHREKYNQEAIKETVDSYDELMSDYLTEIGREQEVNWSNNTSGVYQYVYFPQVYPTLKEQGFKNEK